MSTASVAFLGDVQRRNLFALPKKMASVSYYFSCQERMSTFPCDFVRIARTKTVPFGATDFKSYRAAPCTAAVGPEPNVSYPDVVEAS